MSTPDRVLREESVRQYCRALRLPTVGGQFGRMAEEAIKQQYGPVRYLEALLAAEIEERERNAVARRIFEAKLPRIRLLYSMRLRVCSLNCLRKLRVLCGSAVFVGRSQYSTSQ